MTAFALFFRFRRNWEGDLFHNDEYDFSCPQEWKGTSLTLTIWLQVLIETEFT